jgi:hypothetical protein
MFSTILRAGKKKEANRGSISMLVWSLAIDSAYSYIVCGVLQTIQPAAI